MKTNKPTQQPPGIPTRGWLSSTIKASLIGGIVGLCGSLGNAAETGTASSAVNAPAPKPSAPAKPAWLSELSLGVQEGYDDNVMLVSGEGTMNKQWSWLTTVSPKLGINVAPLLGSPPGIQALTFTYAPDFVSYHNANTENYNAHRLANVIKGKVEDFSFNLDNAFVYVDGRKEAPVYLSPDNQRSAYATSAPRERRAQFQDRAKVVLQYDLGRVFIRPTAYLLYYELLSYQRTNSGYQNYADRHDVNGGLDLGFKVTPDLAFTLGYRYGHQYQERIINTIYSSSSDYHRVLAGVEGKPFGWLTVAISGGPDFRSYEDAAPINDKDPVKFYGEASLTANVSAADSIVFKYKGYQWVSSTGQIPYFESGYDLSWRHKFGKQLTLDLAGKLGTSDYTSGNLSSSLRDDWMYTASVGLVYAVNANFTLNASFAANFGRNNQDQLAAGQQERNREFDRYLTSLGVAFKF